jgi:hypothetical protein
VKSFYSNIRKNKLTMRVHKPAWARGGFIYCLNSFKYNGYCYEIASNNYAPPCIIELVNYLVDNCYWERIKQLQYYLDYTELSPRGYYL